MTKGNNLDFELTYKDKKSKDDVINNTPLAQATTTKTYGKYIKKLPNLLFYGDNLPILKHLLKNPSFAGKIKLIYIDPPFSTNQNFRGKKLQPAYKDQLSGHTYLEFIRRRLILMRELLANDGSIYLHLDSNMAYPIKIIMDDVFGKSNFRNWITRKKSNSKNYTRKTFGNMQDFILFYTKTNKYVWNRPYKKRGIYSLEERFPKVEKDTGRKHALVPIHAPGIRNGATGKSWRGKKPPEGKHWMFTPDKLDCFDRKGEIYWSPTGNPRRKIYADNDKGVPVQDIWLDFKDAHNQNIAITGYPTEKSPELLKRIIKASSNKGDIVLDCFVGSGTTIAVAEELGRKWIGVDNSKLAIYITLKRLLKLDSKDKQLSLRSTQASKQPSFKLLSSLDDDMVDNGNHKPKTKITVAKKDSKTTSITIRDFICNDPAIAQQNKKGFNLLGMIVIDTEYDNEAFNIKKILFGEQYQGKKSIQLDIQDDVKLLGIAIYDIYGNELLIRRQL